MLMCTTRVLFAVLLVAVAAKSGVGSTAFFGSFTNWSADGPSPMVDGTNTSELTWGDPGGFGVGRSSVAYDEYVVSTELILSGLPFDVGRVTYRNGTIVNGTGIASADLFLDPLSDDENLDASGGFLLNMITESTPNVGTPAQNADYLFFQSFVHDPFVPDFFNVYEGATASADLVARLDFIPGAAPAGSYALEILGFANVQGGGFLSDSPVSAVPEPHSLALLAVGLLAASFAKRRKHSRS